MAEEHENIEEVAEEVTSSVEEPQEEESDEEQDQPEEEVSEEEESEPEDEVEKPQEEEESEPSGSPRFRVVLKVLKPRWCNQSKKRLKPGQLITLESDNEKDFRLMVMRHKAKTTIVEGEVPNFKQLAAKKKSKKKTSWKSGSYEGDSYSSYREFVAEKTDEEKAEEEAAAGDLICPECGKGPFKNSTGLKTHMTRAHG